jgi:hypothetical protein
MARMKQLANKARAESKSTSKKVKEAPGIKAVTTIRELAKQRKLSKIKKSKRIIKRSLTEEEKEKTFKTYTRLILTDITTDGLKPSAAEISAHKKLYAEQTKALDDLEEDAVEERKEVRENYKNEISKLPYYKVLSEKGLSLSTDAIRYVDEIILEFVMNACQNANKFITYNKNVSVTEQATETAIGNFPVGLAAPMLKSAKLAVANLTESLRSKGQ